MASKVNGAVLLSLAIVTALVSWALYRLLYTGASDLLMSFGVTNDYWQNILILVVGIAFLWIVGKKNLKGLIK